MCAVCGFYEPGRKNAPKEPALLENMLKVLHHRGPDEMGFYQGDGIAMGHARLSIIGLTNGRQPLTNEDESVWLVYAGEIFNYQEIKQTLEKKGHHFRTDSDGEVITHLYEEEGITLVERLNGQFAFALWDAKRRELYLCRDRLGILPLFYYFKNSRFIFASEIKGILQHPEVQAEIDEKAVAQIFTFWSAVPPRTCFKNIQQVRSGHWLRVSAKGIEEKKYWDLSFPFGGEYPVRDEKKAIEKLGELLTDAVDIRLKADVPVGVYLSGGLDSSVVAALARKVAGNRISTFSVRFTDKDFDETPYQEAVYRHLGLPNHSIVFSEKHLEEVLIKAVYHAETPVLRMAMAPLFSLSGLVREKGFKAMVGGEGADEVLLGYDLFKEVKVREFMARQPRSERRGKLFARLYPYLPGLKDTDDSYLRNIFSKGFENTSDPFYSHRARWESASRSQRFLTDRFRDSFSPQNFHDETIAALPVEFRRWDPMARAQYLECKLFLSNYLLSSQGDRMAMANGIEVRYPYLDHRLVDWASQVSPHLRMRGLREKNLLKKIAAPLLPASVIERHKHPYRAPGILFHALKNPHNRLSAALSPERVREAGYFDPEMISLLVAKFRQQNERFSEADQMALSGALTLQLVHEFFIEKGVKSVV